LTDRELYKIIIVEEFISKTGCFPKAETKTNRQAPSQSEVVVLNFGIGSNWRIFQNPGRVVQ
jgi:predicted ATPase